MKWTDLVIGAKHLLLKQLSEWKAKLLAETQSRTTVSSASTLKRSQEIMSNYGYPTTRKFPRTLAEAFPDERGEWFYPPEPKSMERVYIGIGVVAWIGLSVYFWRFA